MESKSMDWANLTFGYKKAGPNVRCKYENGKWGALTFSDSDNVTISIAATCLHYGQEAFEGLKAFRGKDGRIRIFRMKDNAERMMLSCRGIRMAEMPVELFCEAVTKVVEANKDFVPPYGYGASLYIRPLIFGTTPRVGVSPASEFEFIVFAMPVGLYFKGDKETTPFMLTRKYDRAAPLGTGTYKVGGNYAAGMVAGAEAHDMGYSAVFYLDAREKKYIDECGAANFFAIKNNTYITPESTSILNSITNRSLQTIAEKILGMKVEKRKVPVEELATFEEAGACGTAAIISPVERIDDVDKGVSYVFSKDGKAGPVYKKLLHHLQAIQNGDEEDHFGWITYID
ncbi:MAG: branched-chain amino acid aminotransferase [Paludibacter sp.]|nr:branched-chain amino acid aminotransferase [Paludibacter sp.]